MTDRDVRDLFRPVFELGASVESIHFKSGPLGRYGFVHFAHATGLQPDSVATLNGIEFGGQKLRIEFSKMNGVVTHSQAHSAHTGRYNPVALGVHTSHSYVLVCLCVYTCRNV